LVAANAAPGATTTKGTTMTTFLSEYLQSFDDTPADDSDTDIAQTAYFRAYADERLVADDEDDPDRTLTLDMDGWAQWQAMIDEDIEKGWAEHEAESEQ
jgi:hypothetical protein